MSSGEDGFPTVRRPLAYWDTVPWYYYTVSSGEDRLFPLREASSYFLLSANPAIVGHCSLVLMHCELW